MFILSLIQQMSDSKLIIVFLDNEDVHEIMLFQERNEGQNTEATMFCKRVFQFRQGVHKVYKLLQFVTDYTV